MGENKFYNEVGYIANKNTAHDVAKIEDKGHNPLPKGAVETVVSKIKSHLPSEKAKLEGAQNEADEYEKMRAEQFELGEKIVGELEKAAAENKVFNILSDGKPADGVGPLRVGKLENNAGGYSIIVQIDAKGSAQGNYPLYQIDVRLKDTGKEIHVFTAPYGPDNYYAVQSTDLLLEKLAKEVSEYKLYKESEK
jgi:hypothetical protein